MAPAIDSSPRNEAVCKEVSSKTSISIVLTDGGVQKNMDVQVRLKADRKKLIAALFCGMLGCICFGAGDWLMLYGDVSHAGDILWLTEGVAAIPTWRNSLAMILSFPGIVLYGIALFYLAETIPGQKARSVYKGLTALGLTQWLCLHLFYIMILYVFAWMRQNGFETAALPVSQALYTHFRWLPLVSELIMLPPFLYWFYLQITDKTQFHRGMAFSNVLIIYIALSFVKSMLPDTAFRLGFTNGLMSESMLLWFMAMAVWAWVTTRKTERDKNDRS